MLSAFVREMAFNNMLSRRYIFKTPTKFFLLKVKVAFNSKEESKCYLKNIHLTTKRALQKWVVGNVTAV